MDFDALLEQHNNNEPPVKALSEVLSTPRDSSESNDTRGTRERHASNDYRRSTRRGTAVEEEDGVLLLVSVMGKYLSWKPLEWVTNIPGSILVTFEAKGPDNIVVAFSPEAQPCLEMYEIVIGGWKDSKSVIRRETQGVDRALKTQSRLCSRNSFLKYWATLKDGVVSVGTGAESGNNVILAWRDPVPMKDVKYVSFTSWDGDVRYRNVVVSECAVKIEQMETDVPEYLKKLESERQRMRDRAVKFGETYVEPSIDTLAAEVLTPAERQLLKHHHTGFATGFDPTTEEEKQKGEQRAKRFGMVPESESDADRLKHEERARRFDIPVIEDLAMTEGVINDLTGLRVPRRDPAPDELPRLEAIHLYGSFDGIVTSDILDWFNEYGAARVEWLHDCGANVLFADDVTMKRALNGLAKVIPSVEPHTEQVEALRTMGYFCGPFPLTTGGYRFFLMRKAAVADVKADEASGFRSTIGYQRRRQFKIRKMSFAREAVVEQVTGKRTMRDESDDDEEDWKRKRRDSL